MRMWTGKAFFAGLILGAGIAGIQQNNVMAVAAMAVGLCAGFIAGIGMEDRFDLYQGDQYLRRRKRAKR